MEKPLSITVSQKPAQIYIPPLKVDKRKSFGIIGWGKFSDMMKLSKFDVILDSPFSCDKFHSLFGEINIGQNCFKTKQEAQKITNVKSYAKLLAFKFIDMVFFFLLGRQW